MSDKLAKSSNNQMNRFMNTVPGDNRMYLEHTIEVAKLGVIDTHDPVAVRQRTWDYFSLCAKNDMKPSVEGYALSMGISRDNLRLIRTVSGYRPKEVQEIVQMAQNMLNSQMVDYMQGGKINPIAGIFLMRNNMGYTNDDRANVEISDPLGDRLDTEDIASKYADVIED